MAKGVEAQNVSSYYGSFKAIDNISMAIEPKTITALIGPSGCGKSTFLRSINRMHEVLPNARVEGRLTIDEQNIYDSDVDVTAVRRMIGMVFQRPNPFPTMSIYENVVAGLKLNGVRRKSLLDEAAEKTLRSANLWDATGPGFFSIDKTGDPGRLIEYDDTPKIFSNPGQKRTEDYITGRFG